MQKLKQLLKNAARLNKIAWEHKKGFVLFTVIFCSVAAAVPYLSSGVNALLINYLTANFGLGVFDQTLILLALGAAVLRFVPDIIASVIAWMDKRIWIDLGQVFKLMFIKKKGELDIQTYENPQFQDILNKAEDRGTWPTVNFLSTQYQSIGSIVSVVLGLGILLFYDWRICLLTIIAIIPQFIVEIKYNDDTWGIWSADTVTRRRYGHINDHFEQKNWLIELKLFQNIKLFYNKIEGILTAFNNKQKVVERKKLFLEIASSLISGGIIAVVTFWIIYRVVKGEIEIGTMLFIITSISQLQSSLISFLSRLARLHEYDLYVSDIFKIIDTKLALPRPKHAIILDGTTPEIVFENVSFSYPQTTNLTLEHISLTIKRGEKFALVGENGAGKTTFVKLLCRIYDPTEGRILINGYDLRNIDLDSWYKTLGILFQEYAPYKFEVAEAISFGRSDEAFDLERVKVAAKASESESFILGWPGQYNQMLGAEFDKGLDPSKGQQQRLAIARLLHRKAGLLILDEPTASIDAEAEAKIFDQIEKETVGQTVILISHKYSTVKNANRICVFKGKSVHEIGSHEELMKKDGTYAKLFKEQAEGYAF